MPTNTTDGEKLIQNHLQRMDDDRDKAAIAQEVRLTRIEDTLGEIKENTCKIYLWLTGNGNPETGLISKTANIEKMMLAHIKDSGEEGAAGTRRRVDALEAINKNRETKEMNFKSKAYDLVKPLLGDMVRMVIIFIAMLILLVIAGPSVLEKLLLLAS